MKNATTKFIRAEKKEKFSIITNELLQDKRLSWKARGIMAYILSLPSDWEIHASDLVKRSDKDGREAFNSGLRELEALGYIEKTKARDKSGKYTGINYIVHETPAKPLKKLHKRETRKTVKPSTTKTHLNKEPIKGLNKKAVEGYFDYLNASG